MVTAEPRVKTRDLGRAAAAEPAYRARLLQAHLEAIDALPDGVGARIRARLAPDELRDIEASSKTRWIAAEVSDRLGTAMLDELGPEGYVDHYRRFASRISKTPLFDALARGVLRLFSFSPVGLLRTIPRAWSAVARDVARLEVSEESESGALVRLHDLAPLSRSANVVLSWRGSLLGALDLLQCSATVDVDTARLDEGVVLYHVRWSR